jgi:hypothetical protein
MLEIVATKTEERYTNMAEVIKSREEFLGVPGPGRFTPREEHAAILEDCVKRFNAAPAARQRGPVTWGFLGGCALLALLCTLLGWWRLLGVFAALAVLTPLCWFVVDGVTRQTYLFGKVRELPLATNWTDRLVALAAAALLVLLLWLFHMLWLGIGALVLAASLAVAFHVLIDRDTAARQQGPIEQVQQMLGTMRRSGLSEDALREFVCRSSGEHWEGFYEALFGYEAKLAARERWGQADPGRPRPTHAAWRDSVVRWIDARLVARREAKHRRHLAQVEQEGLEAQGVTAAEAQEQAAEALVQQAATIEKETAAAPLPVAVPVGAADAGEVPPVGQLLGLPEAPGPATVPPSKRRNRALRRAVGNAFELVFGPKPRFLVGAVLLAGCIGWLYQNDLVPGQEIKKRVDEALQQQDVPDLSDLPIDLEKQTRPLSLPPVPAVVTDLFEGFNAGAAALILFVSMVFRGWRVAVFAWPAALVAFGGHRLGVPALGPLAAPAVSMIAGAVLAVPGLVLAARTVY